VLVSIHRRKHFWPTAAFPMQSDHHWSRRKPPTSQWEAFFWEKALMAKAQ
jgi:hypothetical protein